MISKESCTSIQSIAIDSFTLAVIGAFVVKSIQVHPPPRLCTTVDWFEAALIDDWGIAAEKILSTFFPRLSYLILIDLAVRILNSARPNPLVSI